MSVSSAKNKFIVGLTGGISTGKSTAFNYFVDNGFFGIDCDKIVHKLYEDNSSVKKFCMTTFETADRNVISKIVFSDSKKRHSLEQLIHPLVLDEIDKILDEVHGLVVIDMPLLFEINYQEEVDLSILIYLPHKLQIERFEKRAGTNCVIAEQIIISQMSIDLKKEIADIVVVNDKEIADLYIELDEVIKEIKDESQRYIQS